MGKTGLSAAAAWQGLAGKWPAYRVMPFSSLLAVCLLQIGSPSAPVQEFLEEWTTEPLEEINCSIIPQSTKVFLNGVWVGIHRNPIELVRTLRSLRRQVCVGGLG